MYMGISTGDIHLETQNKQEHKEPQKSLLDYTEEELLKELERRKQVKIPEMVSVIDMKPLREMVKSHIEYYAKDPYGAEENDKTYIYEEALKVFYGKKIFDWMYDLMK